ncbi:MAG: GTPase ObgE [Gemmatimonadota bacterium]|nr:GTPase ObgE [Gemmatimonadota bacterium]
MFVDHATIRVVGGAGGAGASAFRREKGVPRGGPAGGNGGRGGDVILVADASLDTLLDYSYREQYRAGRAGHGEGKKRDGADGEDLELPVPPGTLVRDAETDERLGELLEEGDRLVVARGGRGGRGNASFATATNQAPRDWEPGEWGEERRIELELKLIADVGLVGEPNAGKSTLLSRITAARPKVADYPFTTLAPNLGVVAVGDGRSFVVADIPGLIEGAHAGKGLGARFLRHIERTRTLALLIPIDAPAPQETYDLLRRELLSHDLALGSLPHCVIITKSDLWPTDATPPEIDAPEAWGRFAISSVTGAGLEDVTGALWARVRDEKRRERAREGDPFEEVEEWRP